MPPPGTQARDTSIRTYRARRDFAATPEPAPRKAGRRRQAPVFVVQKHDATRLHWDFRLEHGGVLWSWAVPKGPSLDPADKRLAVRTEDHPLDYAEFHGTIPEGHYGAGIVEIWDRGDWQPVGDAAQGIENGELKFKLSGTRLNGGFVLVRLKPRPKDRAENWLLIKEHDEQVVRGADAGALEAAIPPPPEREVKQETARKYGDPPPVPGAVRASLPERQAPQLASTADKPPEGGEWLSEVKFDGYRLLAFKEDGQVRLVTRNGHDWTARLPTIARAVARLDVRAGLFDGELVAFREDGVSSFALLQQAMSEGNDKGLFLSLFDCLHLDGWDLRECRLAERKRALAERSNWKGALRFSDHLEGRVEEVHRRACGMGLEGIICKQADAPYRSGRHRSWLKLKCAGREEFAVLGWTPPAGLRTGIGSLHVGYRNPGGAWEYAGGVGTGFTDKELAALRGLLDPLASASAPERLVYAGEAPDRTIRWVHPKLVAEVRFAGWSGSGRIRHATYLGLREDKPAEKVVREVADPKANRIAHASPRSRRPSTAAAPPPPKPEAPARVARTAVASAGKGGAMVGGVRISHPDRELWPGVTKRDLAEYWLAVAGTALGELANRPLALVRCPEGIDGERFFQKHARPGFPKEIGAGHAGKAPYLVVSDIAGLLACAQVSAIELHAWGSRLPDAERPDRIVFDLDPGEGVAFAEVVAAAKEVRDRLRTAGLQSFCRTTGGKGLHVVAPVRPLADWDTTRAWCRGFAEAMVADSPGRFVSRLPKDERRSRILVDWLRNGLGSTAVASYSPRARQGATVATPVAWREVSDRLDPAGFTLATVPGRLKRQRAEPWPGFAELDQAIPDASGKAAPTRRR